MFDNSLMSILKYDNHILALSLKMVPFMCNDVK